MANKRPEIEQISDCIIQLAERCIELDDKPTASVLYCVAGSIHGNNIHELADLTARFSMLQMLKQFEDTSKPEDNKPADNKT